MKFYTKQHKYTCGIDLHARMLYVCILDQDGEIVLLKPCKATPDDLMRLIKPYLDDLIIGVECMFSWYWVADFCIQHNIEFILGHALYMKAISGGKTKNDKIDSEKIARLMQGRMFPTAFVYPRDLRGTRDLMRRRIGLMRERGQMIAHIQNTLTQYNHPTRFTDLRAIKNHDGLRELFDDVGVQLSIDLDLERIAFYNKKLDKLEYHLKKIAHKADPQTIAILQSIHGVGPILSLTMLYEIYSIDRFNTVQDFASYSRLVKCQHESTGKSKGPKRGKIGNAYLRWAFSEAAVLFLRGNPEAKQWLDKKTKQHNKARALTLLSHKLGRAVYFMLKRKTFFDQEKFLTTS